MTGGNGNGNGNGGPPGRETTCYDPTYQHAGEQCSSTFEGRIVNIMEQYIIHPQHDAGPDLIQKGDPLVVCVLVGVAMIGATDVTDTVSVDTEGIWWLDVVISDVGMGSIWLGQRLYIDSTSAEVSDDPQGIPFGYALGYIPGGNGGHALIAVKVHAGDWPWWMFL